MSSRPEALVLGGALVDRPYSGQSLWATVWSADGDEAFDLTLRPHRNSYEFRRSEPAGTDEHSRPDAGRIDASLRSRWLDWSVSLRPRQGWWWPLFALTTGRGHGCARRPVSLVRISMRLLRLGRITPAPPASQTRARIVPVGSRPWASKMVQYLVLIAGCDLDNTVAAGFDRIGSTNVRAA